MSATPNQNSFQSMSGKFALYIVKSQRIELRKIVLKVKPRGQDQNQGNGLRQSKIVHVYFTRTV